VLSPDGRYLATAVESGATTVWPVDGGPPTARLPSRDVITLAWSPDCRTLYTAGNGATLARWDLATGRSTAIGQDLKNTLQLAASPDGRLLASSGQDNKIRLWNTSTNVEV
jgi:WD40 repeat protein